MHHKVEGELFLLGVQTLCVSLTMQWGPTFFRSLNCELICWKKVIQLKSFGWAFFLTREHIFLRSLNCRLQCWRGRPSSTALLSADETLCSLFIHSSKAITSTCSSFKWTAHRHQPLLQTNCSHHCFHCFQSFLISAYFQRFPAIFQFHPSVLVLNYKLCHSATGLLAHYG